MPEACPHQCPLGKYGNEAGKIKLEEACPKTCKTGMYGRIHGQTKRADCLVCQDGYFCHNGQSTPCKPGTFGSLNNLSTAERGYESSVCIKCPGGKYGVKQAGTDEQTACLLCPKGRFGNNPGMSNASGIVEACPEACPSGQYLEGIQCLACPSGASCSAASDRTGIRALAGFWRIPNTLTFVECMNPCSCLGAANEQNTCSNRTVAKRSHAEGCNSAEGFRPGSRLCADCLPGYTRNGRGGCKKCGKKDVSILLSAAVAFAIVCCLCFVVYSTVVKRRGQFDNSDGAKKIFISYLQLAGLAASMKIPWPTDYITLFRTNSLLSSVGEEFIDIRCAIGSKEDGLSIAAMEYYRTLAYAALPVALVAMSTFCWCTCGRTVPRQERRAMMAGTIVILLYLAYPSISATVLGLWKCEYIDGVGSVFVVDPETLCTDEIHKHWQNLLGLPCVLGYVLGLPATALVQLYRVRSNLDEPLTRIRFGQLYTGFTRDNYMYEGWVTLRKLLIILTGIFSNKLQVLLAIGSVVLLLTHTVLRQPYTSKVLTQLDTLLLSCCFLTYWMGGIFVVYPHCQSADGEAAICKVGEVSVLVINASCCVIGLGTYTWFAWSEKRENVYKLWSTLAKTFRKRVPEEEILNIRVELDEITRSSLISQPFEMFEQVQKEVKRLRAANLKLKGENRRLEKIVKKIEEEEAPVMVANPMAVGRRVKR